MNRKLSILNFIAILVFIAGCFTGCQSATGKASSYRKETVWNDAGRRIHQVEERDRNGTFTKRVVGGGEVVGFEYGRTNSLGATSNVKLQKLQDTVDPEAIKQIATGVVQALQASGQLMNPTSGANTPIPIQGPARLPDGK